MNNIPYLLALHSIDGLGPIRLKAILDYFKDPKLVWEASREQFLEIGIPKNVIDNILQARVKLQPQSYAKYIKDMGINWITIFDKNYPGLLKQIYDPPVVLYYKGSINFQEDDKSLAVVGSRKMTGYGRITTDSIVKGLVDEGSITIVSGLARGIDSQAHNATINSKGRTLAILGGGLSRIYPPENQALAERIINGFGAVISEFPPDAPSLPGNFPSRNRIISGLSLGVVVVEAGQNSGSLITAKLALEQGREVFAVPGPITSELSKGPVSLIRMGAKVVLQPQDILDELGINKVKNSKLKIQKLNISEEEKRIMDVLEQEQMHVDEISRDLDIPIAKVSGVLLKMEISGLVKNLGSGIYCKM